MNTKTAVPWRKHLRRWGIVLFFPATFWLMISIRENQMKERIEEMPMKTVCVGRFLIDVPQEAVISFGGTSLTGWAVSADYDESDEEFSARLEKKEAEIRGQKNEKGQSSLESVVKIETDSVKGKVLVFNREWGYLIEFGKRVEHTSATIHGLARSHGASFAFKADYLDTEHVPELVQVIKQLRHRDASTVPTEPGFCFEDSLIADPLVASQSESTVMFVGLEGHPDLSIALRTLAGVNPGRTLLQRDAENDIPQEHSWAFHTFRKGNRTINGLLGEELMYRVRERSAVTGHSFEWEALSNKDSVFTPSIALELSTGHGRPGQPVQASLSDVEAIALWDKMLSSLRVRPTKPVPAPTAAPQVPANCVQAGQACPASGWWKCDDGDDLVRVQGGAQQYFRQGVKMPQAELFAPRSVLQKLKGESPTFRRATTTTWMLAKADIAVPVTQSTQVTEQQSPVQSTE